METCVVETGLLKKKPCGQAATTKCMNCEMALCAKHAVAELNARRMKTGKYLCQECDKAQRAAEKRMGSVEGEPMALKPPEPAKAPAQPAAKPAPAAAKPAPVAVKPAAGPAAKPAAGKPAEAKPEPAKDDVDAPLEFNPTKKP